MSDTNNGSAQPADHDRKGRFVKGNQARTVARMKRRRGLERYLAQATNNGLDAGKTIVAIMNDPGHRHQYDAAVYVIDTLAERIPEKVELTGPNGAPLAPFSSTDIPALLELAKAKGGA